MNMSKGRKIKYIIILLLMIIATIIIFRLTYAFIETSVTSGGISGDSCFDINYVKGQNINGDLDSGADMTSGFSTNVIINMKPTCTAVGKGTLYLTTKSDSTIDLTDNALKYSVVVGSEVVATGKVDGTENQVIYDNFIVNSTSVTYKVYIWLDSALEVDTATDEVYVGYIHASVVATSGVTGTSE